MTKNRETERQRHTQTHVEKKRERSRQKKHDEVDMKHEETSQSKMWRRKEGGKEELGSATERVPETLSKNSTGNGRKTGSESGDTTTRSEKHRQRERESERESERERERILGSSAWFRGLLAQVGDPPTALCFR